MKTGIALKGLISENNETTVVRNKLIIRDKGNVYCPNYWMH